MNLESCWVLKKRTPLCGKLADILAVSPNTDARRHGAAAGAGTIAFSKIPAQLHSSPRCAAKGEKKSFLLIFQITPHPLSYIKKKNLTNASVHTLLDKKPDDDE